MKSSFCDGGSDLGQPVLPAAGRGNEKCYISLTVRETELYTNYSDPLLGVFELLSVCFIPQT